MFNYCLETLEPVTFSCEELEVLIQFASFGSLLPLPFLDEPFFREQWICDPTLM